MLTLTLAWRNVLRNRRRTAVTVAATTFALWVMILYSGLVEGYVSGMADDVLELEVGDIQAFPMGYQDDPSIYRRIEAPALALAGLEARGFRASPRVLAGALVASGEQSAGVALRGVEVEKDAVTLRVAEKVAEGSWLDPSDPRGVVVGRRLARTLAVHPGSELVVLTQGADGSLANDLYTVRGVLSSVGEGTDRGGVFVVQDTLRELLVLPEGVHQIVVRRPAEASLEEATAAVAAALPGEDVRSWRQILPTVATMLDASRSVVGLVFFLVYVAVGILVLNAMLMAVFERIREFGVMKALGVGPWLVMRVILVESALQLGVATALGLVLAAPFALALQTRGLDMTFLAGATVMGLSSPAVWKGKFTLAVVAQPVIVLLVVVGTSVLWPAWRAARLRPLEAMRAT